MTPLAFDPSVPDDVRQWATTQLSVYPNDKSRLKINDAIRRLVSYDDRKTLWPALTTLAQNNPSLSLLKLLQDTCIAKADFQRLSKVPIHQIKQDALDIGKLAKQLARKMRLLNGQVSNENREAVSLFSVVLTASKQSTNPLHITFSDDAELQYQLASMERYLPSIPSLVDAMAVSLKALAKDEARLRPRRANATNADRTFVISVLQAHFQRAIGTVPSPVVAELVNRALDRHDTTTDTVRKTNTSKTNDCDAVSGQTPRS